MYPVAPVPTSVAWTFQVIPLRTHTFVDPTFCGAPTRAVFPSAESATENPEFLPNPRSAGSASLACSVQTPALRVHTHAAPSPVSRPPALSTFPPTRAVFPSAESATDVPWPDGPRAPVPT